MYLRASELSGNFNESDSNHAQFIVVLESALLQLQTWYNKMAIQLNSSGADDVGGRTSATNIFAVLSDESLIEDGEDWNDLCDLMNSSSVDGGSTVRDLNVDEIDEDEEKVKTIVLCFIIDATDLMQKVENAWKEVAEDSMHAVVAVSVSVTAIQAIDRQFAELQSQLPSIDDATPFLVSICDTFLSSTKIGDCKLSKFYEQMIMYLTILRNFARSTLQDIELDGRIWPSPNFPEDRSRFIEQYSLLPMTPSGVEEFLSVQLWSLHRMMSCLVAQQSTLDDIYVNFPSSKIFLRSFYSFFQTKDISVALLVRCMMWLRIISVLQDSDGLTMGRTIYILRKYCRKVLELQSPDDEVICYSAHLPPHEARTFVIADNACVNLDDNYKLFHHNPLLQGLHLLDLIIQNEGGMNRTILSNGVSLFRLYSAMKQERLVASEINGIPIVDLLMSNTGLNRDSATAISRGNYRSSDILEVERQVKSAAEYFSPIKVRRHRRGRQSVRVYTSGKKIPTTASALYFYLFEHDLSTLDGEMPLSSSELVETVAQLVTEGLFEKRTLSLSAVKFGRIFNGVYLRIAAMFPELTQRIRSSDIYPRNGICEEPSKVSMLASVYKMEINAWILAQLDNIGSLSEGNLHQLRNMCKRIGAIIVDTLRPIRLEKELYIFKKDEKGAFSREFGDGSIANLLTRDAQSDPMKQMLFQIYGNFFMDLQAQFERFLARPASEVANKKIQRKFIDAVKTIVKNAPGCLQMTNLFNSHFATIFDYAVCVLKDVDFVEWLVQMRGFLPRGVQFLRVDLSRVGMIPGGVEQTHLQCACQHQIAWAIDFILTVSQGIDRNFIGYNCNNTALHYIVKMGDPLNVVLFTDQGNFIQNHQNNQGKAPFDLAETQEMKDFLKSCGLKLCEVEDYSSQQRKARKEVGTATGRELDAVRAQSSSARSNARKDASALAAFSSEDIARVEQAEKELLEMLDAEDASKAAGGGGKKKTSKKSVKTKKK